MAQFLLRVKVREDKERRRRVLKRREMRAELDSRVRVEGSEQQSALALAEAAAPRQRAVRHDVRAADPARMPPQEPPFRG